MEEIGLYVLFLNLICGFFYFFLLLEVVFKMTNELSPEQEDFMIEEGMERVREERE